jgi:glucokinase
VTGISAAPALVADVGGTNIRFALIHDGTTLQDAATLRCADYLDLVAAMRFYLAETRPNSAPSRAAVAAVAAPVAGDNVELTNNGWSFSIAE